VELEAVSEPELEQVERLGSADLVVGILDSERKADAGATVAMVREALAELSQIARVVVVCNNGVPGSASKAPEVAGDNQPQAISFFTLPAPGPTETPQESMFNAYRSVLAAGGKLGVRACAVIASKPQAVTPRSIFRLVQPVLELGFDLVAPRYIRHKMEGLLNTSILSPLHRALYGEQIQNPLGPDFGLSGKLLQRIVGQDSSPRRRAESSPLALLASTAACCGFKVCESHLGARTQRPTDWMNLSSLLADVLAPIFLEMERNAAFWQSIRGSKTLPVLGSPETGTEGAETVDVRREIESFKLGTQNLQDVWDLVLPPTILLELRKLSRVSGPQFRMPDDLWVRIVYDFAIAYRLRTINRDHLLRSITPLYLGWIASYALEVETAGPAEIESRIERLSRSYEANKPYLVSRWRWPDRFSP
jgi:hypothetical protein